MTAPVTAPLSWAQRHMWLAHHRLDPDLRHELHVINRYEPPPGSTVRSLSLALTYLVRRHEVLRSTFHVETATQQVHPPARLPIACVETTDQDTAEVARVTRDVERRSFDLETDWPIRGCLFTAAGEPTLLIVVLHHIAVDDWCMVRLRRELEVVHSCILNNRPIVLPAVTLQPAGLAVAEQSGHSGDAASALAYWRRELSDPPADPFRRRRGVPVPSGPPAVGASLTSPDALEAARELAARYQTWPSTIFLTAFAIAMRRVAGADAVAFRMYCANRETEEQRSVLGPMFLPAPMRMVFEPADTFEDAVVQVAERTADTVRHAYAPFDEVLEMAIREECRVGAGVHRGAVFNYLNHANRTAGVRRTVFSRTPPPLSWSHLGDDAYFRLYQWQDCVVAVLSVQSSLMTPYEVERFLRAYEAVLIDQAAAGVPLPLGDLSRWGRIDATDGIGAGAGTGPPEWSASAGAASSSASARAAQRALVSVVEQINGLEPGSVDGTVSYVVAGGRIVLIPAVLHALAGAGWSATSFAHLAGTASLAEVAWTMRPRVADPGSTW